MNQAERLARIQVISAERAEIEAKVKAHLDVLDAEHRELLAQCDHTDANGDTAWSSCGCFSGCRLCGASDS